MNPKHYSRILLAKLENLKLPIDLHEIAKIDGIDIQEIPAENFEGTLVVIDDSAIIGVSNSIRESGRKRFTIAHEFGHYYIPTHRKNKSSFSCTGDDLNTYNEKDGAEYEANEFAADLLMPEDIFRERIKKENLDYDLLTKLTDEFDTSLTATSIKYGEFKREYAVIYSTDSKICWFRKNDFPYFISYGKLGDESIAINFFNGDDLPTTFQAVPATAWLDNDRLSNDKEIEELSISLPYYNSVLTFLFTVVDDEEEDIDELDGYLKFRH